MGKYFKTRIINGLKKAGFCFVPLPKGSTPHKRGVYYFEPVVGVDNLWGAMDQEKEGQKYKKRIVVRPSRFRDGLFELYTYHFPKRWSVACMENREMIKEAQRRAHALEKDCTAEGLEWRIRFLKHYFRVFKGGGKPEEGMKPYSRFYQYTYVAIYRALKAESARAKEPQTESVTEAYLQRLSEEISFEPIDFRPRIRSFSSPLRRAYNYFREVDLQPPEIQVITDVGKITRTTEEFAYVREKQ